MQQISEEMLRSGSLARGYTVIPTPLYDAFCDAVGRMEESAAIGEHLLNGCLIVANGQWGSVDAWYRCLAADNSSSAYYPTPRQAALAHMKGECR